MNLVPISVEKRELGSKGYLRSLRASGKVPGILHGPNLFSQPIIIDSRELRKALSTPAGRNVLLSLQLDGENKIAMIENLQKDFLKDEVFLHVDLRMISLDQKIEVSVPIVLVGHENRAKDEGIVSQALYEIDIRSKPTSIPESIKVDISGLTIGDSILLRNIPLPEDCELITDPEETVVSIIHSRAFEEEAEEVEPEEEVPTHPDVHDTTSE